MMLPVSPDGRCLLLRTDFSDDAGWVALCALLREPVDGFEAEFSCVSDHVFDGLAEGDIARLTHEDGEAYYALLADAEAISGSEHSVLAVDMSEDSRRMFRVIPSEVYDFLANLEIGNLDFHDFAEAADEDGVFRGFRDGV